MAQHVEREHLYVFRRHVARAAQEGMRLGRAEQEDAGSRDAPYSISGRSRSSPQPGSRVAPITSRTYSFTRSST